MGERLDSTPDGARARRFSDTTRGGFFQRPAIRKALRGVSFGARALYDEVLRAAGRSGWSSVRQGRLAALLGVSDRTVRTYERELEGAGLVYVGRFSHWIRAERGGVSRVLVPAVVSGGLLRPPAALLRGGARIRLGGRAVLVRTISGLREAFRAVRATYRKLASGCLSPRERREPSGGGGSLRPPRLAPGEPPRSRAPVSAGDLLAGLVAELAP